MDVNLMKMEAHMDEQHAAEEREERWIEWIVQQDYTPPSWWPKSGRLDVWQAVYAAIIDGDDELADVASPGERARIVDALAGGGYLFYRWPEYGVRVGLWPDLYQFEDALDPDPEV